MTPENFLLLRHIAAHNCYSEPKGVQNLSTAGRPFPGQSAQTLFVTTCYRKFHPNLTTDSSVIMCTNEQIN